MPGTSLMMCRSHVHSFWHDDPAIPEVAVKRCEAFCLCRERESATERERERERERVASSPWTHKATRHGGSVWGRTEQRAVVSGVPSGASPLGRRRVASSKQCGFCSDWIDGRTPSGGTSQERRKADLGATAEGNPFIAAAAANFISNACAGYVPHLGGHRG